MPDERIRQIADNADMIIRGYAFTRKDGMISVFNTNDGESAVVFTPDGTLIETNMDEIECALVMRIWQRDSKYMET